jgi:hypothetical protein
MLNFTARVVADLPSPVGTLAYHSRVAAIHFDSNSVVDFNFSTHASTAAVQTALLAIKPTVFNGSTATHDGINSLNFRLLTNGTGWRHLAVPTVLVIVTDGPASDASATIEAIQKLNERFNDSLLRIAIGIDVFDDAQLFMLANNITANTRALDAFWELDLHRRVHAQHGQLRRRGDVHGQRRVVHVRVQRWVDGQRRDVLGQRRVHAQHGQLQREATCTDNDGSFTCACNHRLWRQLAQRVDHCRGRSCRSGRHCPGHCYCQCRGPAAEHGRPESCGV